MVQECKEVIEGINKEREEVLLAYKEMKTNVVCEESTSRRWHGQRAAMAGYYLSLDFQTLFELVKHQTSNMRACYRRMRFRQPCT